jgi:hypothetical protein
MAEGVMLAVSPPAGENNPYALGDSQGKTVKESSRVSKVSIIFAKY